MYGARNGRDGGEERDGEGVEGCGAGMDGTLVAAVGVLRFLAGGRWGRRCVWRDRWFVEKEEGGRRLRRS